MRDFRKLLAANTPPNTTVLYLLGFAFYPILFLYSKFPGEASWSLAPLPMLLSGVFTCLIFAVLKRIFRNEPQAAVLTCALLFLFFSYGHLATYVGARVIGGGSGNGKNLIYVNPVLGAFWFLFLLAAVFFVSSRKRQTFVERLHQILPSISATLIVLLGLTFVLETLTPEKEVAESTESFKVGLISELGYNPDIYFIVLDGYARADILKQFYGFDNQPFLESLRQKNFQVLENSFASYPWTHLSLTSALNMSHLHEFAKQVGENRKSRGHLYQFLQNNRVSKFLRQRGYRYIHLASTGGETMMNPYADKVYSCRSSGGVKHEIYRVLIESSLLRVVFNDLGKDLAECHKENYQTFSKIPELEKGPKFVFAHIVSPHHPYLFDDKGNVLQHATISNQFRYDKNLWADRRSYVNQTKFINATMYKIFGDILQKSEHPPVIILSSDHGPHLVYKEFPDEVRHTGRFANLLAVHLPQIKNQKPFQLLDNLRLVNLFPSIFNYYFDSKLKMESDELFLRVGASGYSFKPFQPLDQSAMKSLAR